jgi:hypothetical protein
MKIALLTEGRGEFKAFPNVLDRLAARSGHVFLPPSLVDIHPLAKPTVVAKACLPVLRTLKRQQADLAVLVLDREVVPSCSGDRAKELEAAIGAALAGQPDIKVVLKDRAFENWLVADLAALRAQPGRYAVSESMRKKVEPGKADSCKARELLKTATKGRSFHKVEDAVAICERLDPLRAAAHSRSFRHLLHVLGDPAYAEQCRRPAPA